MLAEVKFCIQSKGKLSRLLFGKTFLIAVVATAYAAWMISCFNITLLMSALVLFIVAWPIYFFVVRHQ